jgi:hypothetical protein
MLGFTDARLAKLTGRDEGQVRRARRNLGVTAVFKRIDTCAAEFEAQTPYMYSTYEAPAMGDVECEARPSNAKKVVILGGGPNRIGQGIEFDYCCCHACYALTAAGYETIMVNCNPETVSTDYDTSDRLYFEPLTLEHVLEILRVEQENGTLHGVIVQFGGQTPLKLANALHDEGIPILGTTPDAIDLAEDRERFQKLLHDLGLRQPVNGTARSRRRGLRRRRPGRLSAGDPPLLRAGRPRDGNRPRRRPAGTLHPHRRAGLGQQPGPAGQLPVRRDRGGCRCPVRRDQPSMSRASWNISRRRASIPATPPAACRPTAVGRNGRGAEAPDRPHGPRAACRGPDERAIRHQGRHDLCARGEPPRLPHRALRRQGHRQRHRLHRRAADGGRAAVELPDARALPRGRRPRHAPAAGRPADAGRPPSPRGSA